MKAPEVKIIEDIQKKLDKQFPNLLSLAMDEFREFHEDVLQSPHVSQLFYGWIFNDFCLVDGKTIPSLCFEVLSLTNNEKKLLNNIQNAIHGLFEVLGDENKIVSVQDLMTKKEYQVLTIDLDPLPKGICLEASLAKNLNEDYFFFGGFYLRDDKESISWNLLEYSRHLTLDERAERELEIIQDMEKLEDRNMLFGYLHEILGMRTKKSKKFLRLNRNQRRDILKAIIAHMEINKR